MEDPSLVMGSWETPPPNPTKVTPQEPDDHVEVPFQLIPPRKSFGPSSSRRLPRSRHPLLRLPRKQSEASGKMFRAWMGQKSPNFPCSSEKHVQARKVTSPKRNSGSECMYFQTSQTKKVLQKAVVRQTEPFQEEVEAACRIQETSRLCPKADDPLRRTHIFQ